MKPQAKANGYNYITWEKIKFDVALLDIYNILICLQLVAKQYHLTKGNSPFCHVIRQTDQ